MSLNMDSYFSLEGRINIDPPLNHEEKELIKSLFVLKKFSFKDQLVRFKMDLKWIFENAQDENIDKMTELFQIGYNYFDVSEDGSYVYIPHKIKLQTKLYMNFYNLCNIIFSDKEILQTLFPEDTKFLRNHKLSGKISLEQDCLQSDEYAKHFFAYEIINHQVYEIDLNNNTKKDVTTYLEDNKRIQEILKELIIERDKRHLSNDLTHPKNYKKMKL